MNLEEKLATINEPKISKIKTGSAKTISDFWSKFIEPNLLPEKVVSEWWKLLKRYVDDKGIVLAIRAFRGRSKSAQEKNKDEELRGGFYTITGSTYNYFYTDNDFTAYFYKMAMDGFYPTYNEFKKMMVSRKFPAKFRLSCEPERKRAAFIIDGTDPGISTAGYKISHIFDVGSGIWDGKKNLTMAEVCEKFFPRGKYKDWTLHNDSYGDFYARELGVKPEAEKIIKAIFLRMTCPLNYVLTPKKDLHTTEVRVEKNDIGESRQLQQYAMFKFHEKYGKLYTDYLNEIGLGEKPVFSKASENFVVGIKYGPSKIAGGKKTKTEICAEAGVKEVSTRTSGKKGKQSFLFNGDVYTVMSRLALAVVKKYVEDHPGIGYNDLKKVFCLTLSFDKKNLIRRVNELTPSEKQHKRALINPTALIVVKDAKDVCVNSQWQSTDMPHFIRVAKKLGYEITKV